MTDTGTAKKKKRLTWPIRAQLVPVDCAGRSYTRHLEEFAWLYHRLLDPDDAPSLIQGAPKPTVADVGVLAIAIQTTKWEIGLLQGEIERLEKFLEVAWFEVFPTDVEVAECSLT